MMRGSILHPNKKHAFLAGVATAGVAGFLIGFAVMRLISLQPPRQTQITMQASGTESLLPSRGSVFWMDEETGKVPVIGQFTLDGDHTYLTLNVSDNMLHSESRYIGIYWTAENSSYVPHMHFLFNADLRDKLDSIMSTLWQDQEVRNSLNQLVRSPGLRNAVIDFVVQRIASRQNREIEPGGQDRTFRRNDDSRSRLWDDPAVRDFFNDAGHEGATRQQLVRDPALNQALDGLLEELEPHFRKALDVILWSQPDDIPNARLIWVARRTMMGSRNPAILLVADPAGSKIRQNATIPCREAP